MLVLLPPGLEIAERMYERHKLPTELLIGLGVSPETARDDACKIEHDLSEENFCCHSQTRRAILLRMNTILQ